MSNTKTDNVTLFSDLVKQECRPKPGLLNFFTTKPTNIFDGEKVEYDKVKGKRLTALAKLRHMGTTLNGSEDFRNVEYTPPIYKESRPYNIANFRKRIAGVDLYTDIQKEALIMQKTAEDTAMMLDKIRRGEIAQAAEIFQTGKIQFKTNGLSKDVADVDFEAPSANFADLTGAAGSEYWDDANADPIRDLEARIRQIQKEGCTKIRDIIMGYSAAEQFVQNSRILNDLDNRRITRGEFLYQERDMNGMALLGNYNLAGSNVRIWTYEDYYLSPADNSTTNDYIDPKKVVLIGDGDYQVYYAGIDVIRGISNPNLLSFLGTNAVRNIGDRLASSFYVDTYKSDDNTSVFLRVQSAPLYVPKTNDTFGCMQVLA